MGAAGSARAGAGDAARQQRVAALYEALDVASLPDARRAALELRLRDLYATHGGDALWTNGPDALEAFEQAARALRESPAGDEPRAARVSARRASARPPRGAGRRPCTARTSGGSA